LKYSQDLDKPTVVSLSDLNPENYMQGLHTFEMNSSGIE
jgi:hypothetical protein